MTVPHLAVPVHFPAARLPAMITRLTTYLIEQRWSFVQTCHQAEQMDFDIFDRPEQFLMRVTLHATGTGPSTSLASLAPLLPSLPASGAQLLRHLVQPDRNTPRSFAP